MIQFFAEKPTVHQAYFNFVPKKKHQEEYGNYRKSSGNYNNSKNASHDTNDQPSNYSRNNSKGDRRIKALAVEEKSEEKTDEPKTSSSSSKSDCSEDKKGLLCLFSHEDSDEELCCMAEEEEVTSQNCSSSYSSESSHHENSREAFERMMKDFNDIESTHFKLKEENAQLLAERQDLEDLKCALLIHNGYDWVGYFFYNFLSFNLIDLFYFWYLILEIPNRIKFLAKAANVFIIARGS
nr:lisH domain-containing protein C1711.05-like [Ipomoea batatas]